MKETKLCGNYIVSNKCQALVPLKIYDRMICSISSRLNFKDANSYWFVIIRPWSDAIMHANRCVLFFHSFARFCFHIEIAFQQKSSLARMHIRLCSVLKPLFVSHSQWGTESATHTTLTELSSSKSKEIHNEEKWNESYMHVIRKVKHE